MRYVREDGKVGVVISPGFGAGWSTWNSDHPEIAFHYEIVQAVLDDRRLWLDEDEIRRILGLDEDAYLYCSPRDLEVVWLDPGTEFIIHEYDGSESIQRKNAFQWLVA